MAIDTHDAMATRASFMAPVGDGQIPFLLVALKQWREIQRRIEEGAAMVAAEDLRMRQRTEIWPDPVFCTRCYESVSTDSSSSGLPAFSTFLSRSAATANSAGVR
jgi:hypothetical protein